MTRFGIFHIELENGGSEVVAQPITGGPEFFQHGGLPSSDSLTILHQAVLDEKPDRVKVRSLIFVDRLTVNGEIEIHKPAASVAAAGGQ